jgi:hypothetical protein
MGMLMVSVPATGGVTVGVDGAGVETIGVGAVGVSWLQADEKRATSTSDVQGLDRRDGTAQHGSTRAASVAVCLCV